MGAVTHRRQPNAVEVATAIALAVGGAAGMAGSFAPVVAVRQVLWGLDGTSLVCAAAFLTVKHLRRGDDLLAAGFLVFAAGQTLVLSTAGSPPQAAAPPFASGIALWAAALVILGLPKAFPIWGRIAGFAAALAFLVTAAQIFCGAPLTALSFPLPALGYPLLVIALVGWIVKQLRPDAEVGLPG